MAEAAASEFAADQPPDIELFEEIFATSNRQAQREKMVALSWQQFEQFVQYIFECAGYRVQPISSDHKHHVDLLLFRGDSATGKPLARVEVRRYKTASIIKGAVVHFVGALVLEGTSRGYLVTTSTFTGPAKLAAGEASAQGKHVHLIDGEHLSRYIAYLRASRRTGADGRQRTPSPTGPEWLLTADTLPRRDARQTTILAIANNKGGVAKTTSALNLGVALSARGKRVLLVDMDGQASLSLALPLRDPRPRPPKDSPVPERDRFLTDYYSGRSTLGDIVQPTRFPLLWLIPAHRELYARDTGGAARPEDELAFVQAIHALTIPTSIEGAGQFDWIIFDTPPAQSCYTRAALAASHYILIPAAIEVFAVQSINRLLETAQAMAGLMGKGVNMVGCVVTRWDGKTALMRDGLVTLRLGLGARGIRVLDTKIPNDAKIARAHLKTAGGSLSGLFDFRRSPAAEAYVALLKELVKEMAPHVNPPSK
jgi:chromosome partitioning protein